MGDEYDHSQVNETKKIMTFPMQPRNSSDLDMGVGSETGIEQKDSSYKVVVEKYKFDWLASIKNIFNNLVEILKIISKWR